MRLTAHTDAFGETCPCLRARRRGGAFARRRFTACVSDCHLLAGCCWCFSPCRWGAATHVVWDAFTHAGRWGTAHVPWLADEHGLLPGYRWAQYGGGVFGVLVVGLARWWQSNTAASPASGLRPAVAVGAWLLVLVAGAAGAAVGSIGPLTSPEGPDLRSAFFLAATRDIAPAVFVALLFAASWHLVAGRQPADGEDLAREGENT